MATQAPPETQGLEGVSTTLSDIRNSIDGLDREAREQIVDQALLLMEQLYVHLPLKRAMHAVEPVQRLRLLRRRAASLSERQFHDEMIRIFSALRDSHTRYILPAPYQGMVAVLPFRIQMFIERGQRHYVVTEPAPDEVVPTSLIPDPHFRRGALVTHWNSIAIDRAVELNAERQTGSNLHARHAQGLSTLTMRPMAVSAPPDEDWVVIGYEDREHEAREVRIEWRVVRTPPASTAVDPNTARKPLAFALALDGEREMVRRARKTLFAREAMRSERHAALGAGQRTARGARPPASDKVSALPDALQFQPVDTPHGQFGHLRIWSFNVADVDAFEAEVVRILKLLPQEGVIVDVRGNPGGVIMAGERLLQLFTPRRIEPERLHLINTPLARELCERNAELARWAPSIAAFVETGTTYSDGFPLTSVEECNARGQHYHGPAVLLTDALCYSTTDIFIAGWQDHAIGPILGTSENTGAGGANVWYHGALVESFADLDDPPIKQLPGKAFFRLALRRCTRVGEHMGVALEDLGVTPQHVHELTLTDLLHDNRDLIDHAGKILAEQPVRRLDARATRSDQQNATVTVTTKGLARVDAYVDGRPWRTLDVNDGEEAFEVPVRSAAASTLELYGFDTEAGGGGAGAAVAPVAARRLSV